MSRHVHGTTPAVALRYQKAKTLQTAPLSPRTQGPQRERNCAHRGGEDSHFSTEAEAFFTFEARGDGYLRSQERRTESWCETDDCTRQQTPAQLDLRDIFCHP
jgi:hypothetical protein